MSGAGVGLEVKEALIEKWPQCAECTNRRGEWTPVEAYHLEDARPKRIIARGRIMVHAACSHGRGMNHRLWQTATIEVPHWWGNAHVIDAIASLNFFATGRGAPEHGLVTDIT